ncbi:UDP-glucose/GDP-mannose dehydrogenase family protein [Sporolactobacillus sp. THM19-2]|jgi:UDPglucose 6-dehydrogenase|uniref:UDP-glucose dehydrogenase family protein n=1 Tax=Sporolactobacillus sp. THM19-2 TaxID=2511171 RepID=UPI00101F18AD|nr:UDP-glucose/GDP-mannose dehydrogenase family protein [Sporolactobacillus sp. THM19-2]RYL94141.1 UDP-glucose/GDP-mannose dehydrogenase family protein [Sporolactobacillus sp. THM19-2]
MITRKPRVKGAVGNLDICIIGAGYVGLTSAAVLAELGHHVRCLDTDSEKIKALTSGEVPFFEPGLKEMIQRNHARLSFSVPEAGILNQYPVVFIAVGTPSAPSGQADLTYVRSVIDFIAGELTTRKTIITKSTVPPGTNEWICRTLKNKGVDPQLFDVISNPEFLREGSAISDTVHPDKIVVGKREEDHRSLPVIEAIYQKIDAPYVVTSLTGAELIKYTSNAFLAAKISFINEIARICDAFEVNIEDVARGIRTDPRIGPHFLQAGIGYGGSCFPKDVRSLVYNAGLKNVDPVLLRAVQSVNHSQIDVYLDKLRSALPDLSGKKVTVLGIAFKPNTDDTRYSPGVALIQKLSELGCTVSAYDPEAKLPGPPVPHVSQVSEIKTAVEKADAVVIATDWEEFIDLDWAEIKAKMNGDLILDARNCIEPDTIRKKGLRYLGVARP